MARSLLPDERRRMIAELLRERGSVTVAELEERFGISLMTARRDLAELERAGIARRTHGGAVLPGLSGHEDSFTQRLGTEVAAKERLASAALRLLEPGAAIYVDSSTSAYIAARRVLADNLRCTLLTNSLPVMDLVCESAATQVDLVGVSGSLRPLTRSFVGPQAVSCVQAHFADYVLFSVRGVSDEGVLTDPDPFEAEVKRMMLARSRHPVLLLDGTKAGQVALAVVADVSSVRTIICTGFEEPAVARMRAGGVSVQAV